jgi:hypothetical protein
MGSADWVEGGRKGTGGRFLSIRQVVWVCDGDGSEFVWFREGLEGEWRLLFRACCAEESGSRKGLYLRLVLWNSCIAVICEFERIDVVNVVVGDVYKRRCRHGGVDTMTCSRGMRLGPIANRSAGMRTHSTS